MLNTSTKYVNSSYLVISSWVEVDISDQIVTLHKKNGTKYVSSCVTGNVSAGNATPTGVYNIYYKQYSPSFLGETLSGASKYAKNDILLMGDATSIIANNGICNIYVDGTISNGNNNVLGASVYAKVLDGEVVTATPDKCHHGKYHHYYFTHTNLHIIS